MKKSNLIIVTLSISIITWGCGQGDLSEVKARNLETGAIETFSSDEEIPQGYMVCPDEDCRVSNQVPCESLGGEVCELNPDCRLKVLWCTGGSDALPDSEGSTPGSSGSEGSDNRPSGADPASPSAPSESCEVACVTIGPLQCEELADTQDCQARADCEWAQGICPNCPVTSDGADPSCECSSTCQTKQAPICLDLDQQSCDTRPDCQWEQLECPCEDNTMCTCSDSACVPSQSQVCPPMAGSYPVCTNGAEPVPVYDSMGCMTHYQCSDDPVCPPAQMPAIGCENGAPPIPVYDAAGCITSWHCTGTTAPSTCKRTGCSGQVCSDQDVATDCMWAEHYQCYDLAICGMTADGNCGWINTPDYTNCMENFD